MKQVDLTAQAHSVRTFALLDEGNPAEAAKSAAEAQAQLARSKSYVASAESGIAAALAARSIPAMQEVLAEARKTGTAADVFEARLHLYKLQGSAKDLAALSREAKAKGFGLIAQQAR
jgi:pyruvate/2-oxoglutarate dehydrogenase complex dihydrolipoamide acyltransferase (E2) component